MESLEPVQREGSPEDDGNLSASATLARDAAGLFQSGHYHECIGVLNQLLQKKEDDPKVLHNIAVAEYYSHGCTDPQKLLEALDKVKKRNEELVRAVGDQVEGISSSSNNSSTLVTKSSSSSVTGAQQASTSSNSDGVTYLEEYDTSIATLNTAVILYNLQHYENAMSVLKPVYQNIEPIDETTALRICLLMLDIALASHEAAKAADVVQYMEKAFVFGYVAESGGNVQYQSVNQPLKSSSSTPVNLAVAEAASGAAIMNTSTAPVAIVNNESSLTRTLSDEACDYEALLSTFDSDSQNLGRSSAPLLISTDLARPTVERPAPANDLKLQLHLYKVRLLLLTRNLKATKREVKLAMNIARGRDSSTALLLKAQLEYSRGNHRKAIKLLTTCSSRAEQGMSCMLWNNLGCIHHKLMKDNIAAVYFKKAYQSIASPGAEQPLKLSKFSQDKSQSIMYNCGMLHLMRGNPTVAAQCFQLACYLYYNQPRLWLRLAECCISAQEKGLLKTSKSDSSVRDDCLKVHVFGDGRWRHIVLQDGITTPFSEEGKSDSEEGVDNLSSFIPVEETFFQLGQPVKLSMLFARQCLQMSLWLLKRNDNRLMESVLSTEKMDDEDSKGASNTTAVLTNQVNANGDAKESKGNTGSGNVISSSVDTYEEMQRKENMLATEAVLASLAYVELSLDNPLKALTTAELLSQQPVCSREYIHLARIYAAEALCHLNRIKEAAEHLSVCMEESNGIDLAINANEDGHKWRSGENSEASGDGEDNAVVYHSSSAGNLIESQNISHITGGRARSNLYVNLAVVSAMQGDFQQAHQYSTQAVLLMPTSTMAMLAVVYVELLQGKTHDAISKLKQYRHLHVASPKIVS